MMKKVALKEMLRVLIDNGEIVIGDITLQGNPPDELITDEEYYTDISDFISVVEKNKCSI